MRLPIQNSQQKYQFSTIKMDEPTIHEKSIQLIDSDNPMKELLMSCLIYSAEYYPLTQNWLTQIILKCSQTTNRVCLISASQQLAQDLFREIIYGPSACFVTAADRPHHQHLDSAFIRQGDHLKPDLQKAIKAILANSWISQFIPQSQVSQLLWYRRSNYLKLSNFINKKTSPQALKQLEVNGQSWLKTTPLPTLLLVISQTLQVLPSSKEQLEQEQVLVLKARISFLHNKILQNPAKELADRTLSSYRQLIDMINKSHSYTLVNYVALLLQYAHALVFYYKYAEAEKIIELCKSIAKLDIEFTGRLGRRTKFQSFDTPQLVMNLKDKQQEQTHKPKFGDETIDEDAVQMPNAKQLVLKQLQVTHQNQSKSTQIESSSFDQQSILLEKPKYVDEGKQQQKGQQVTLQKVLVALAATQYMWDTSPKQEILYQQVATSIQTILEHKELLTYPLLYNVLILRSLNQFPRTKNVERALDQLQKIKANFNQKSQKNIEYLFTSAYLPYLDFIRISAQKYMEIGMTMTAIELYEKVGMIQECIDGLIAKSFKEKAMTLATKYEQEHGRTPRLLCMLGDLQEGDKGVPFYEQAWKLSQHRNARCQRSLGWHYFGKKQYNKAAEAFKKATEANFYHPNTWFTLGCCYLQLKDFQKAIPAFGECVCIDETQGDAWGNIATCYIHQGRYKEAYSTLEQALKYSQRSWKMWSNMISVAPKLKKFYKFFESLEKLVDLQRSELITPQLLGQVTKIFKYQQGVAERRRIIQAMKNRLDRVYRLLVDKIGQNPSVWRSIYEYNLELEQYTIDNYKHYKKLHADNNIDKNDLLDGFQTEEGMHTFVQETLSQIRENVLSSKQTQLNMTMKVGWQSNKHQSEKVLQVLQEYVTVFQKYGDHKNQKTEKEFNLFINGVRTKIQACLQRTVQIQGTSH